MYSLQQVEKECLITFGIRWILTQLCTNPLHTEFCQKYRILYAGGKVGRIKFRWDIRETVTFLDPGFHETTQEEFDGDIKDRPTSLKDIKKMGGSIIVGR